MWDKTFEDTLGEFSLEEKGQPETGSVIGVWIEVARVVMRLHVFYWRVTIKQ